MQKQPPEKKKKHEAGLPRKTKRCPVVVVRLGAQGNALGRRRRGAPVEPELMLVLLVLVLLLLAGGMYVSEQSSPNPSVALALFVIVRGGQLNSGGSSASVVSVTVFVIVTAFVIVSVVVVSTVLVDVTIVTGRQVSVSVQYVQEAKVSVCENRRNFEYLGGLFF
jgi:hypothetical protein